MFRTTSIALVTVAALSAAPALAQMSATPMSAKTYVMKAGAGDQYEIQSSKLELASTNPDIKAFASKMISDHTQSTADVKAAARRGGVAVAPPHMNAMQMANMAKLRAAHGKARDALYVSQQKTAHQMALALHQSYAENGKVAPLKMAAGKIAPVVQGHIDMLNTMGSM